MQGERELETGLSLAKCERTSKMEIFHESLVKQSILIYDFLRQLRRHWTRSAAGDSSWRRVVGEGEGGAAKHWLDNA